MPSPLGSYTEVDIQVWKDGNHLKELCKFSILVYCLLYCIVSQKHSAQSELDILFNNMQMKAV